MEGRQDGDLATQQPDNCGQQGGGTTGDDSHSITQLDMIRLARNLRDLFRTMGTNLDRHHKNVNIARIAGGSVATIGGGMAIGAGIAIPFTFGISIIFAIVGGVIAAAGGVTAGGAGIFKYIIDKKALREAEKKWILFCNMFVTIHNLQDKLNKNQAAADGLNTAASVGAAGAAGFGIAARETLAVAGVGGRAAATASRLAAAAASVTVLVNVVLLGFSLYDIIDGSLQIHREAKSEVGDVMRKLANELDDLIGDVDDNALNGDFDDDLLIDGGLSMDLY